MMMGIVGGSALAAALLMIGSLLSNGCALLKNNGRDVDEDADADRTISMNDLPAAVKTLAEKETSGCRIIEVEQEMKDGKIIYAITYDQAGTEMEIEYMPDGILLSKEKE